jgi:glycosyltransferase involved in cell wall biosynthesis
VFVARGSVRKGLPVLLDAWREAGLKARLILVGGIEPEVLDRCAAALRLPSVEACPFSRDLARAYGNADVFVLPSFEEGSPLVSYMALAAGLPCIMSPAAAGWVVRDGKEGFVLEPDDKPKLIEALRLLAGDRALRQRMGEAARLRAADYTWERCAARRLDAIEQALAKR